MRYLRKETIHAQETSHTATPPLPITHPPFHTYPSTLHTRFTPCLPQSPFPSSTLTLFPLYSYHILCLPSSPSPDPHPHPHPHPHTPTLISISISTPPSHLQVEFAQGGGIKRGVTSCVHAHSAQQPHDRQLFARDALHLIAGAPTSASASAAPHLAAASAGEEADLAAASAGEDVALCKIKTPLHAFPPIPLNADVYRSPSSPSSPYPSVPSPPQPTAPNRT